MERKAIFIKDTKTNLDKIKSKYDKPEMSDGTALKIIKLDKTFKGLKIASTLVGFVTIVDLIVPDPVLGLDEAALASITGLLTYSASVINTKINNLVENDELHFNKDDITKLAEQVGNVYDKVGTSKKKILKK